MTNRTYTGFLFLILAAGLAGCDGSRSTSPSAPSPAPQPAPPPTATGIQVAGTVSDAAWRYLVGARVEVVEGPQAGLSTTTDAGGQFRLTGAFDDTTRFRATKEGHVAATFPLPPSCAACNPRWWIHFSLESLAPRPNIAGDYTLTFIADGACTSLPDDARTRTYEATVTPAPGSNQPANSRFNMTVSGATLLGSHIFQIGIAGDYFTTGFGDGHGTPGVVEQVAVNTYVTLDGGMSTTVTDASNISGTFQGTVDRCELKAEWGSRNSCTGDTVTHAQCESPRHQLILKRR